LSCSRFCWGLVVYSFNVSGASASQGFTVRWYADLLRHPAIYLAFVSSFEIGLLATAALTLFGTMIAFALTGHRVYAVAASEIALLGPMVTPEHMMTAGLLVLFTVLASAGNRRNRPRPRVGRRSLATSCGCIPFVVVTVRARLRVMDRTFEEAPADLGAVPITTFTGRPSRLRCLGS
jgi:spermidine/putrescine transport system permease protein